GERGGDGGEDAARHRHEGGGEGEADVAGAGAAQVLLDLRHVPVAATDGVGRRGAHALGGEEVRLERLARPGVAVGKDGDDVTRVDDAGAHARLEGEGDGGDVAAGHGHGAGLAQDLALGGGGAALL